jgi:hypothetical protein
MNIEALGKNNFDGILGMNPGHVGHGNSFVKALKREGKIEKEMVSFWINTDSGNANASSITIGGQNKSAYKGELHTHKIIEKYNQWWTV